MGVYFLCVEMNEGLKIYSMYNVLILDLGYRRLTRIK